MELTNIIDTILSDTQLIVGVSLLFFGVILFVYALVKWLALGSSKTEAFIVPHQEETPQANPTPVLPAAPEPVKTTAAQPATVTSSEAMEPPAPAPITKTPPKPAVASPKEPVDSEKTMMYAPGVADVQAQLEIAISQIRQLSKRVMELEHSFDSVREHPSAPLEKNELAEPPKDAEEFTKKLLKVVEHVIVLEKEMTQIKSQLPSNSNPS